MLTIFPIFFLCMVVIIIVVDNDIKVMRTLTPAPISTPSPTTLPSALPTVTPSSSPSSSPSVSQPTSNPSMSPTPLNTNATFFLGALDDYAYLYNGYYAQDPEYNRAQPHSMAIWNGGDVVVAQTAHPRDWASIRNYDGSPTAYYNVSGTYIVVHDASGLVQHVARVGYSAFALTKEAQKKKVVFVLNNEYFLFRIERMFQTVNDRPLYVYDKQDEIQLTYDDSNMESGVAWVRYNASLFPSAFISMNCGQFLERSGQYLDLRFDMAKDESHVYLPYSLDVIDDHCNITDSSNAVWQQDFNNQESAAIVIKATHEGVIVDILAFGMCRLQSFALFNTTLLVWLKEQDVGPLRQINETGGTIREFDVRDEDIVALEFDANTMTYISENVEAYFGDHVYVANAVQYNITTSYEAIGTVPQDFTWIHKVGSWRVGMITPDTSLYPLNLQVSSNGVVAVSMDYFATTVLNISDSNNDTTVIPLTFSGSRSNVMFLLSDQGLFIGHYVFSGLSKSTDVSSKNYQFAPVFRWDERGVLTMSWSFQNSSTATTVIADWDDTTPVLYTDDTTQINYLKVWENGTIVVP